jgi:hypothetical protein
MEGSAEAIPLVAAGGWDKVGMRLLDRFSGQAKPVPMATPTRINTAPPTSSLR